MPVSEVPQVSYYLGLDLGQSNDRTAVCVLERTLWRSEVVDQATRERALCERYDVRHLERPPLGTSYPAIVERVAELCEKLARRAPGCAGELLVDATGVGKPVVDLLRGCRLAFRLTPISITGGERVRGAADGLGYSVPKRDLVAALVVLFQSGNLRIAEQLSDAQALVHELVNFRGRVSAAGHDSYGNGREAQHDDLVCSVALAAWRARWLKPGNLNQRRPLPLY